MPLRQTSTISNKMILSHIKEQNLFISSISTFCIKHLSDIHVDLSTTPSSPNHPHPILSVSTFAQDAGFLGVESAGHHAYNFICLKSDLRCCQHNFNELIHTAAQTHGHDHAVSLFGSSFHDHHDIEVHQLPSSTCTNIHSDNAFLQCFKNCTPNFEARVFNQKSSPSVRPPRLVVTHQPYKSGNAWKMPLFSSPPPSKQDHSNKSTASTSTPTASATSVDSPSNSTFTSHALSLQSLKDKFTTLKQSVEADSQSLSDDISLLCAQCKTMTSDIDEIKGLLSSSQDTIRALSQSTTLHIQQLTASITELSSKMDSNLKIFLKMIQSPTSASIAIDLEDLSPKRKDNPCAIDPAWKRTKSVPHSVQFSVPAPASDTPEVTPTPPSLSTCDNGPELEGESS